MLKACGNRRSSRCRACSEVYRADAWQLIAAGLRGGKGLPETVANHPRVFVTFTAPSFGPVHAQREYQGRVLPCRPRGPRVRCRHGEPVGCWAKHEPDDPALGTPLCRGCFDYEAAVLWNALAPELWRRTTIYLRRALAHRAGTAVRLAFAKVAEYQQRGAIHFHAVIRLDGAPPPDDPEQVESPPAAFTAELLAEAIRDAVPTIRLRLPATSQAPAQSTGWGEQLDIRCIGARADDLKSPSAEAVAAYIAKYATKATEGFGPALDRRLTAQDLDHLDVNEHIAELVRTCWRLADARRDLHEGRLITDERTTVEAYLRAWLEIIEPTIAANTHKRYGQLLRLHAYPHIGRLRLTKLEPPHLGPAIPSPGQGWPLPHHGPAAPPGPAPRAEGRAPSGLAARNVADLVTPPAKDKYEFVTFSPEQAWRFLKAVKGNRLEALYVVGLTTGMREGELLGLRWADVDLDGSALHVTRRLKRRTSRRQVLLVVPAVEALKLHRERQDDERRRAGATWHDEGLVFPNIIGRPINPSNFLHRSFYPLLKQADLPRMRFHDLRHSAATLLLSMGVHPKIVSEMLGHTQIGITLDLYSHVTATMQREAVEAVEELLGSTEGSKRGSKQDEEPQSTS